MPPSNDGFRILYPDASRGQAIAPVRIGIDNRTLRPLGGFAHVEQSLYRLFATRYHQRVMRYYVGSFVPHLIGKNTVHSTITKFWWAITTAVELWEPGYGIKRVRMRDYERPDGSIALGALTTDDDIRRGQVAFQMTGEWYPRGHLGDKTPAGERDLMFLGDGNGRFHAYSRPTTTEG